MLQTTATDTEAESAYQVVLWSVLIGLVAQETSGDAALDRPRQ